MSITVTVRGDEELIAKFNRAKLNVREVLKARSQRIALLIQRRTKQKLSDDVLRVRSNKLRGSINFRIEDNAREVSGTVGTNVVYGKTHEYGFNGVVTVREHLRKIKNGGTTTVREHPMHMKLKPRSFLRTALEEMRPQIRAQYELAYKDLFR